MKSLLLIVVCFFSVAAAPTTDIKVDQVGYSPLAPKFAFVVTSQTVNEFFIRKVDDSSIAFRGVLSSRIKDEDSGDQVEVADFSSLQKTGKFYLEVPSVGKSWSFSIGSSVYERPFYLAMRAFYGQRCGTAVDLGSEFPNYKHGACHLAGAYHKSSGKTGAHVSEKGWHDAGDYGRYIVNSGISTGELLWTWEMFGRRISNVKLNIPESNNNIPDILDEIRWNLDWMLTMQDEDGGVWPKQTTEEFADFVMPDLDKQVSYVIGTGQEPYKSSAATADFAAVMSIAARVYRPFDTGFTRRCLAAAEKAWSWLQKYPNVGFKNPSGVETGEYGDEDYRDEILWAAAELGRTTKKSDYERYFLAKYSDQMQSLTTGPPSWQSVGALALWTYVMGDNSNQQVANSIREASLKAADQIVERTNGNGYRISLTTRDFIWGSNGMAANYGVQLLVANWIRPNPRYVQTAAENLHYLLGRNTFSLSFVTQVGDHPFHNPHHAPSLADKNSEPWPGLLSGGPNRWRQDPAMKKLPPDLPPAKMYLDDWESYASNEIAINWNAPLVFLLAGLLPEGT